MDDVIYRQAAIDVLHVCLPGIPLKRLNEILSAVPSAQPEIIRCKDCKYWHRKTHNGIEYFNFSSCDLNHYGDGNNFYCADAEPKGEQE